MPLASLPAQPRSSHVSGFLMAERHRRAALAFNILFSVLKSKHLPNSQGGHRPFLIPDVIITSVHASSGSPHTPGTTPSALSHLPTSAAPSSDSHTYLSQTTRPTPTAPHVTNRPRPENNYSHLAPIHVVQTAPAAGSSRGGRACACSQPLSTLPVETSMG